MEKMHILSEREYIEAYLRTGGKWHWYGYPRGFVTGGEIYINKDAFFLDDRDYLLLIRHEEGHIAGKEHTWFGVMSDNGLIRYLTTLEV